MSGLISSLRDIYVEQKTAVRALWFNKRQLSFNLFNLLMVVFSALIIWKSFMAFTGSESPVVVVLSGSMEPAFQRGDILFLTNWDAPVDVGEIVVFKIHGRDIPIVHRVLQIHETPEGDPLYLTKGDNNAIDDRNLYAPGQLWLSRTDIVGRVQAGVPYLGMVTIMLTDYPYLKYVLIGVMCFFVFTSKEA